MFDTDVFPGAPQICDGLNNDCDDPGWPTLPANEVDGDGDLFSACQGDCDDARGLVYPGAPQICDGINNDCDDPSWPSVPAGEAYDDDLDTFLNCADCAPDNPNIYPGATEVCDGVNNDCNHPWWPLLGGIETDDDLDGYAECDGDCDDSNDAIYPGADEINDGIDQQCPGVIGHGAVDEISRVSGFHDRDNLDLFSWTSQQGADDYEVARTEEASFATCDFFQTTGTSLDDPDAPPRGGIFYYLVGPASPNPGSLGTDSSGADRSGACATTILELNPTEDAYIDRWMPDATSGSNPFLLVRNMYGGSASYELASALKFDLSSIPAGANVQSAKIHLNYYLWQDNNPAGRPLDCYTLTEAWDEATLTWNSRPSQAASPTSATAVPSSYGWMSWDVTADVQAIVDGAQTDYGWIIRDDTYWGGGGIPFLRFRSKEYGSDIPYLEVMFD
jgi:hypothetical protein